MRNLLIISVFAMWLLPLLASAQEEIPEGDSSLAITLQQLEEDIQNIQVSQLGIVLHTVLPRGWELAEQGIDRDGTLSDEADRFVLVSWSPAVDEQDTTDLIVKYTIYRRKLLEGIDQSTLTEAEINDEGSKQKWLFLNELITLYLQQGFDCKTPRGEIQNKRYGTGDYRPYTEFVPIRFEEPQGGSMLYTFTSFYGDTIYTVSFLATESQVDNYKGLIGFVINNTFALTEQEYQDAIAVLDTEE